MATTLFTDLVTLTAASWFNNIDTYGYSYLTSPAGTNTITATGPASMTAYAAGQKFSFLPANDNTGATTLNITQSGAAALGAKNIFCGGAACVGGEIQAGIPCTVQYDGTQFNLVGPFNGGLVLGAVTLTAASPQLTLGVLNSVSGGIKFFGSTSGNVTLAPNVAAGASVTVTLPAVTDTLAVLGANTFTGAQTIPGVVLTGNVTESGGARSITVTGALTAASLSTGSGAISGGALTIAGTYTDQGLAYGTGATKTVGATDLGYISDNAGSATTMTLPAAGSFAGRHLSFLTLQAQTVVSDASNVYPLGSSTAGTAILAGTAGKWCEMYSDGATWRIIKGN